jgi:hypothetical protein
VVISVADTGPGITLEDRERVFMPFEQLEPSARRKHGGTGLGLAISKSFVELHGGQMWLESEKGRGSTFFVRIPTGAAAASQGGAVSWLSPDWEFRHLSGMPFSCRMGGRIRLTEGRHDDVRDHQDRPAGREDPSGQPSPRAVR